VTRVLVTNDDGIESAGLQHLAIALHSAGYDVLVVAPNRDNSGIGAAIGLVHADQHLDVEKVAMTGGESIPAYSIEGPPGLCVCAGRLGAFGEPPDIVVSGINPGCNTGRAILHSGTVGAALTAQSFGCSAMAVSVDATQPWRFDTAARVALDVLPMLLDAPPRSVLNLNVPALDYDHVRGVRWARLAAFGSVRAAIAESENGGLQFELRATGVAAPPDSDQGLVDAGFASLTTIVGVAEAWPVETAGASDVSSNVVPGAQVERVHAVPDASAPRSLHRPLHSGAAPAS
jgi:5'/3'-nucleotidase